MGIVSMRMCMGGLDIGPAFRVERRFDFCAFAAQRSDQRFQCMVAPQANAVRKELDRDVAVAEMKGDPRQRRCIHGSHFDERLGLGHHFDEAPVLELQRVSHAQMRRLGEC